MARSSRRVLVWETSLLTTIRLPPPQLHPIPALLPWTLAPLVPPIAVPNARKPFSFLASSAFLYYGISIRGPWEKRVLGVLWTEEEHRLFLFGLQKLGKGD